MSKRGIGIIGLILIVCLMSFVIGAENSTGSDKAYQCLNDQIEDKDLSLQEAIFTTLALGKTSNAQTVIDSEEGDNCWPTAGCKLKETAQVALAYDRIGKSTNDIEKWISGKNATATDLTWYLEIDINNKVASECTLKYDGNDKKVNIGTDMKITGNPGSCLTVSSSGYWLKIKDSCVGKNFEVSCNQDFITTLVYEKNAGGTIYVSSETHSAASLGTTEESVKAKCFKTASNCDYEGSLWAALALNKLGENVDDYVPYLLALAEENKKYFPSAFLFLITNGEDQYSQVIQNQKQSKYWEIAGSPYNRYYDTSLAMLALSGESSVELDNAKSYLLSIQTNEGCWNNNNIRDTAMVLYSGWGKSVSKDNSGGGSSDPILCESKGYSCERVLDCNDAGGTEITGGYECSSFGDICCSLKVGQQSCSQVGGEICSASETCSGEAVPSSQGSCCLGACEIVEEQNLCVDLNAGTCKSVCGSDEEDTGDSCGDSSDVCCTTKTSSSGGLSWIWILLILILILLIIFAIVYRDKIKLWWYERKGKTKSSPVRPGPRGPPGMSPVPMTRPITRPMMSNRPVQPVPRRSSPAETEMEDTLKKLRDMSK